MEKDMVKNIYKSPRRLRVKYTHRTTCGYALCISRLHRARCDACGGIWRLPRASNLFEVEGCTGGQKRGNAHERNQHSLPNWLFRIAPSSERKGVSHRTTFIYSAYEAD